MQITKQQKDVAKFAAIGLVTKPALACVRTTGLVAVATDSYRLVETTNLHPDAEESTALMLDARSLLDAKVKTNETTIHIAKENGKTFLTTTSSTQSVIESSESPDEYPKYESIWPTGEPIAEINVNGKWLAEIADYLSKFETKSKHGGKITIKLYGDMKPMVLSAEGYGQTSRAMLMPLTH